MKNLILFGTLVILLVAVQFAKAQTLTLDEIVDKHITAMGGKEKLLNLKTLRMNGSLTVQGADVSVTVTKSHMVGVRTDISVMGTENYQIATPEKGIVFMPIFGQTAPSSMEDDQLKAGQAAMDAQGALVNYKEKGTEVVLVGKEKVDGAEAYNLKLTYKTGFVVNYYLDATTFRLIKNSYKVKMRGEEVDAGSTYSNYKQDANGYWHPFTAVNSQGQTDYSSIETNITVDPNIFKGN